MEFVLDDQDSEKGQNSSQDQLKDIIHQAAMKILANDAHFVLESLVNEKVQGLNNISVISKAIQKVLVEHVESENVTKMDSL
jgi:hypothetical protein